MNDFKIDNTGSGTLFRNKFLESLTRTHFAFPVIMYFLLAALVLIYGIIFREVNILAKIYLIPLGMMFFTLVEYLIHRFLFHFNAESEKEKQFQYTIHGVHHEFPKDKDRLAMPPVLSVLLALFFYGLFRLTMGESSFVFYPGFVAMYSVYLIIHFILHRFHPPKNIFKSLWRHHALHHYKSMEGYYSVSFPFWDYLFRTISPSKLDRVLEDKLPDTI